MEYTNQFYNSYTGAVAPGFNGRYTTADHLRAYDGFVNRLKGKKDIIGISVEGEEIPMYTLGDGPVSVLMWSQMHGNESTTTRALADVLHYLEMTPSLASRFLRQLTIYMIPILNPDGARAYTRLNAAGIDLNRDAQHRSQPESRALRRVFDRVQPDYCLNLHDQRTIFSAGTVSKPATVSFLSPSFNAARDINAPRMVSMQIISGMNKVLQEIIPGQVGRYDDGFNMNCVGDTFMAEGVPTILFESGHYQNDYLRNVTRKCIAVALFGALELMFGQSYTGYTTEDYFTIPENEKLFCDVLIPGVTLKSGGTTEKVDLCMLYKEVLRNGKIDFDLEFDKMVPSDTHFGHKVVTLAAPLFLGEDHDKVIGELVSDLRKRMR